MESFTVNAAFDSSDVVESELSLQPQAFSIYSSENFQLSIPRRHRSPSQRLSD
jgi:hypothetical protein